MERKLSPFQFRTELSSALSRLSSPISLSDAFRRNKNVLLDEKTTKMLVDSSGDLFRPNSEHFADNVKELLSRQCDLESVARAYTLLRERISGEDLKPALEYSAKYSKNVLVWTFLTSVLEWNLGTRSLRFLIKEQNTAFCSDHQKYLFHERGTTFVSEKDMIRHYGSAQV